MGTEYEEECWTETEQECTQETECFDAPPPSTSYSSSSSKHKRSVDDDLEISDEELKETLDSMSASDLLELSEELVIQESLAESDGEAGRSKRGLLGLIGLKLLNKKINKIPAPVIAAGTAKLLAPKAIAPKIIGAKAAPLALAPAVLAPKAGALAAKATGVKIGAKKGYLKSEYKSSSS